MVFTCVCEWFVIVFVVSCVLNYLCACVCVLVLMCLCVLFLFYGVVLSGLFLIVVAVCVCVLLRIDEFVCFDCDFLCDDVLFALVCLDCCVFLCIRVFCLRCMV